MKIDRSVGPAPIQPTPTSSPRVPARQSESTEAPSAPAPRRDSVEFSAAGREFASLHPDRVARLEQVRERLATDFYSSPDVLQSVARRLLASGEI
ncbi:MAG: hypothetical protein KF709_10525 [Gemmatimonadaceae bacterium]|nr:hypothetical protein [Gemmatimonadaceae bacterium]